MTLALALTFTGWRHAATKAELAAVRVEAAGNRADGAARTLREKRRQGTEKATERATAALAAAKASHPTWADSPVPTEVQDAFSAP